MTVSDRLRGLAMDKAKNDAEEIIAAGDDRASGRPPPPFEP